MRPYSTGRLSPTFPRACYGRYTLPLALHPSSVREQAFELGDDGSCRVLGPPRASMRSPGAMPPRESCGVRTGDPGPLGSHPAETSRMPSSDSLMGLAGGRQPDLCGALGLGPLTSGHPGASGGLC